MSSPLTYWRESVDVLGRKQDADFLTSLLAGRYARSLKLNRPDQLVVNINAKWGTGKTYLLDRWAADLEESGWTVLRFNAWEQDYAHDPLMSFVSSLYRQIRDKSKPGNKVAGASKKFGIALAKHLVPVLAKNVARAGATVVLGGISDALVTHGTALLNAEKIDELLDSASNSAEQAAKKMLAKEEGITVHLAKFREALEKFALSCSQGSTVPKPLVLLVDELDRCRPNFAIDLLEVLKHIFSVPGVYSVVATDSAQLAHTAQGAYGAGFDGTGYLRRFFDLQYLLPEPERQNMAHHLLVAQDLSVDPVLLTPITILKAGSSSPDFVYRSLGTHNDIPAARAMIVAAISETLELSNREMSRMVELIRAVVDSNEAQNIVPKRNLHFFYLACLCGVFLKDSKAIQSLEATRLLLAGTSATPQKVAFYSSIKSSKTVAKLFDFYRIENPNEFDDNHPSLDPLERELVNSFFDSGSFVHLKDYPVLVARCGQLSKK